MLSPRSANLLLAAASLGLATTVVAVGGWYRAVHSGPVAMADLSAEDRQRLVEEFFQVTGKAYTPAWYEPRLAYTLKRDAEVEAWNDTFRTNSIGYRAGSPEKPPGVYRVVFVGDSWTYGMGVRREEAFPAQFERLANEMAKPTRIEAWPLALPGYNMLNELTALELFYDRLKPNAVVLCPTRNDTDSNHAVLPGGFLRRPTGDFVDVFGHDQALFYFSRFPNSYRARQRWGKAFLEIRKHEEWLGSAGVPFMLFFVAAWESPIVHDLVAEAGIEASYVIGPPELNEGRWQGPPPWGHGTPEGYALYGRMAYRGLANLVGWPDLPVDATLDSLEAEYHPSLPRGDWRAASDAVLRDLALRVPTRYRRGGSDPRACASTMDCRTGLIGRRATFLLRRASGQRVLAVKVERVADPTAIYPLEFSVSIPTAHGGASAVGVLSAEGPSQQEILIDLPDEVEEGAVLDVELRANRVTLGPDVLSLRSMYVVELDQRP